MYKMLENEKNTVIRMGSIIGIRGKQWEKKNKIKKQQVMYIKINEKTEIVT